LKLDKSSISRRVTAEDTEEELRDLDDDEAVTRRALEILESQRNAAYEAALAELRDDTQGWWADTLKLEPDELEEDEEPATTDVAGLHRFLEGKVLPWFEGRREEISRRPLLRNGSGLTRERKPASSSRRYSVARFSKGFAIRILNQIARRA
jgi:hypothetical protein